jgi:hypothetical protein
MLVVWFRDGKLYKAQACSAQTWRRTANSWNEYAELWNRRFGREKNVVGIVEDSDVKEWTEVHHGKPCHTPRGVLAKKRLRRDKIRNFPCLPVRSLEQ